MNPSSPDKRIVNLFGPFGAGKSTLARALQAEFGEARMTAINSDFYLEDRDGRMLSILGYDFPRLARQLAQPVGTVCACPEYDFRAFRRIAEESGWNCFTLRPIVLVDSMLPFPPADLFIQLLIPRDAAVERVARRNPEVAEWPAQFRENWERIANPPSHGLPAAYARRLVLDGLRPVEENIRTIRRILD